MISAGDSVFGALLDTVPAIALLKNVPVSREEADL